jgi:hypothetical protein
MNDHYIVVADHGHLRILKQRQEPGQTTPALDELSAMDFPGGLKNYTEGDTDMAGRFQGSKQQGRGPGSPVARTGMSIDERLPMQREAERRRIRDVAEAIEGFFSNKPGATWDFAAAPSVHNATLDALSPRVRSTLRQSFSKDLVHERPAELIGHFGIQ